MKQVLFCYYSDGWTVTALIYVIIFALLLYMAGKVAHKIWLWWYRKYGK